MCSGGQTRSSFLPLHPLPSACLLAHPHLRARRQIPAGVRKGGFSPARPALTWALPPDQPGAGGRGRGLYLEEPSNLPTRLGILPSVPPRTCSGRPSIDCPPPPAPQAPSTEHGLR
ncbi:hypothetical protein EI555_002525 [Monodon monoceros]|uniref:Uncharacterized protein n=1 Tax=Monodon monoceros TaxID=40151 RepID=A0A4U1FIS5_MONMO|nr:hypothetical protein EI555_002525 [Monodon monoceros]